MIGLQAECKMGGRTARGLVRDLTQAGAFITSRLKSGSGGVQIASELTIERLLQVGDRFLLVYLNAPFMHERTMTATVRWRGFSSEHNCDGFGVQFAAAE
jgi:hypothetical protein